MKSDIFYYFTEELTTREPRMFTFDSYQGDVGDIIVSNEGPIYEIIDFTWETEDLADQMEMAEVM